MPKIAEDLHKHTLFLRKGDWEKLAEIYPEVATSIVVRRLISSVVDRFEQGKTALDIGEVRV